MGDQQLAGNPETLKVQDWSNLDSSDRSGVHTAAQDAWSKDAPVFKTTTNNEPQLAQLTITDNGKPIEQNTAREFQTSARVLPRLADKQFDAEKVADEIEAACNEGGLFGAGTDEARLWSALKGLNEAQIKAVDDKFAQKHGIKYASEGKRWGLAEEFKDELGGADLKTAQAILNSGNEVPEAKRVDGNDVITPGSNLQAGETNRVTFADGRKYDVYVPKNAQQPLPVIMVMHGVSQNNAPADTRYMEKETSMNEVAEQQGFAVVYVHGESRTRTAFETGLIENHPNGWILDGRKNLLATDNQHDDVKYLDNVLSDVKARIAVDETRIGLTGMSDGGRAAQQFALDRPGTFSALGVMHGTWMQGERMPAKGSGTPIMFVHGTSDYMLPYDQGKPTWGVAGPTTEGRGFMALGASPFVPGTIDSRPWQQVPVWSNANDCTGAPKVSMVDGTRITEYSAEQCKSGEIKEYVITGANHAWQDWRNEGGWVGVGMPSRNTQFSSDMARFILSHQVKRTLEK